jgi:hypothetical protein
VLLSPVRHGRDGWGRRHHPVVQVGENRDPMGTTV